MTQTGQNSMVRTRDEQKEQLLHELDTFNDSLGALDLAEAHIAEAEARGAEEQRRKDAEEQRPFAYCWTYGIGGKWRFSEKFPTATSATRKPKFISPLYMRPAIVPVQVARVKELEEAATDAIALIRIGRPVLARSALQRVTTDRAALTREGGV